MIKHALFLLALLLFPMNLLAQTPQDNDEGLAPWKISVVTSPFYAISARNIIGINYQEDWSSPMMPFSQQLYRRFRTYESVTKKRLPNYDGLGLPLDYLAVSGTHPFLEYVSLPDEIDIHWNSTLERRSFFYSFKLTKEIKAIMRTPRKSPRNTKCYYRRLVFGLIPGGSIKVWLDGCGKYEYLSSYTSEELDTYVVHGKYQEGLAKRIKKKADELGIPLFPIVKERVEKVYRYQPPVKPSKPVKMVNRCWDNRPTEPLPSWEYKKEGKVYEFERLLWQRIKELPSKLGKEERLLDLNDVIRYAYQEAEEKQTTDDRITLWALARLAAAIDYPIAKIIQAFELSPEYTKLIHQFNEEICRANK
ncbi:DUF2931 family protein [Vibrio sp. S9_S30]|uniref:DUF2931 family protein n=1 Tax=Vibrio sp. S9_S30 TaxID=2720226 RepID=UPI00168087D5|nr:DUF2931 family protein [Vibrio sp. S9_S30]MBD1557851.1 DUF2931 family protein [Vibrio sp. S9_S30]